MALNLSFTTKVEKYICWSRHWYCTMDDKPNTLLAGQLVPKPFDSALPKLWLQNGQLTQNPQLILREFFNFYSKPYASPEIFSAARAKKWFYDLHLSSSACRTNGWRFYGGWGRDSYQKPIKSNFPDITIVNMQKFCPPPTLFSFVNDLQKGNPLPPRENNAFIHVKTGQGPWWLYKLPSNLINKCRPQNNDKDLVLNISISKYIHSDQVEFVLDRQAPDQIRRLFDIITALHSDWDG